VFDIDPKLPMFTGWPEAQGPGVHADEADSQLLELMRTKKLGKDVKNIILNAAEPSYNPEYEVRSNPAAPKWLSLDQLVPIAQLTTGVWGNAHKHYFNVSLDGTPWDKTKAVVPARPSRVRSNPPGITKGASLAPGSYKAVSFTKRMQALHKHLSTMRAELKKKEKARRKESTWTGNVELWLHAVEYVLQENAKPNPSLLDMSNGLPFGIKWGVLAGKGNKKLPFFAYSELPMATCPGAGACSNWCYSFKAWRYPAAFGRQFLNTLAAMADREWEFRKIVPNKDPNTMTPRERLDVSVRAATIWPSYVKGILLDMSKMARKKLPQEYSLFFRLFVDGDMMSEDRVLNWMEICRTIDKGSDQVKGGAYFEVYGYTKCWAQFANLEASGYMWPRNYTVNLSSGSAYSAGKKTSTVRGIMESLPISRGYFEAINIREHLEELQKVYSGKVKLPKLQQFNFSEVRIKEFLFLNTIKTREEAMGFMDYIGALRSKLRVGKSAALATVRKKVFDVYFDHIMGRDSGFAQLVKNEVAKDQDYKNEKDYLNSYDSKYKSRVEKALTEGKKKPKYAPDTDKKKALQDKALALALHEVLWTFDLGGSCPLICGNCSDEIQPTKENPGVHRCASKQAFVGKTIHIGLH